MKKFNALIKHGFIGFGKMAQAIHQGLKNKPHTSFAFYSRKNASQEIPSLGSLEEVVAFSDVLWLCIKPQDLPEILSQLKDFPLENKTIVSPVAGVSLQALENELGKGITIVRIMPNLAVAHQKSVTAFVTNDETAPRLPELVADLNCLGKVVSLPEKDFDRFTAIFGSGPAFLLSLLDVFRTKIEALDLTPEKIDELLVELVSGTMAYFQKNSSQKDIGQLIQSIASKGGVTEAGLLALHKSQLPHLFEKVIVAAEKKSAEMTEAFGQKHEI